MSVMFANKEVASRHLPIAHGRDIRRDQNGDGAHDPRAETRARPRISETRLQVTIVPKSKRDDVDLYADVPCTD